METLGRLIMSVLQAFANFVIDLVLSLVLFIFQVLGMLFPDWHLPDLHNDAVIFQYCRWVAYYIPVDYVIGLYLVYLAFIAALKVWGVLKEAAVAAGGAV